VSPEDSQKTDHYEPDFFPMRIVSLLPSATEIVCEVGLGDRLVGVTHECDFPPGVSALPHVTRTNLPPSATSAEIDQLVRDQLATGRSLYQLDHDRLAALMPDLIITQTLCDVCAVGESDVQAALCRLPRSARVLNLEPQTLQQVLDSLVVVAEAAGVPQQGVEARRRLQERIDTVSESVAHSATPPRAVVLEWIDPPFSAGRTRGGTREHRPAGRTIGQIGVAGCRGCPAGSPLHLLLRV
jgi:iron complex transport system substrate-binding protein